MSQSTLIVGLLAGGFLLYLAANNRLSTYTNVLWGPAPAAGGGDASGGSSGGSTLDKAVNLGKALLPFIGG